MYRWYSPPNGDVEPLADLMRIENANVDQTQEHDEKISLYGRTGPKPGFKFDVEANMGRLRRLARDAKEWRNKQQAGIITPAQYQALRVEGERVVQ